MSGLAHAALGSVIALGAIARFVSLIGAGAFGVQLSAFVSLPGLVVSYYGMYLPAVDSG